MTAAESTADGRIGYQDVRDYLKSRGWISGSSKRSYTAIYRSPKEDIEVVVPLDVDLGDYDRAMARVADLVAHYERRTGEAVRRDLRQPRVDVLRFALEGDRTSTGSVNLYDGESIIRGAKTALLASACSVQRPIKHHPRLALGDAETFVRSCTLGQTEHGSFVLTVGAPLEIGHEPKKTPFGRKATEYLMRAVDLLANAIRQDELDAVLQPQGDQPIVSANLCDALVDMLPSDESADLRVRSSWSPLLPVPQFRSEVLIDRTMFEPLDNLRSQLRPPQASKDAAFLGFVVELSGEPGPNLEVEGEVTMSLHTLGDAESVKARVILGPEDYRKAADAHLASKAIHIKGLLRRGGRINRLEKTSEFRLV